MSNVGDRVRIASTQVDQGPRDGVVTGAVGQLLGIRWSTGEESTVVPGPGAVVVTGKVRASSSKKTTAPAKATKSAKKTAKQSTR